MISWIDKTAQTCSGGGENCEPPCDCPDGVENLKDISSLGLLKTSFDKHCHLQSTVEDQPFVGLMLWHAAIRSDFKEILDKLYKIELKELGSLLVRINFLTDVLIFYR